MSDDIIKKIKPVQSKQKIYHLVKKLSNTDKWTLTQTLLQDVQADDEVTRAIDDSHKFTLTKQIDKLKIKINNDYREDEVTRDLLLESIPHYKNVCRWVKTPGWKEAVRDKIRNNHAFNNVNQAKVLHSILLAATSSPGTGGSIKAAELYFKLEGSLGTTKEKDTQKDLVYNRYKNLQNTLNNKK